MGADPVDYFISYSSHDLAWGRYTRGVSGAEHPNAVTARANLARLLEELAGAAVT
jgi:hypothetical protein